MTTVYVVMYSSGCHSCAGRVCDVYDNEDAANAHVAALTSPNSMSGEGYWVEDMELSQAFVPQRTNRMDAQ